MKGGAGGVKESKIKKLAVRLCLLITSEAIAIKDHPHMSRARMAPVSTPNWMGESIVKSSAKTYHK